MKIGRKAIFGMGKPIEISGSQNHRTMGPRATMMPSGIPITAAIANPATVR